MNIREVGTNAFRHKKAFRSNLQQTGNERSFENIRYVILANRVNGRFYYRGITGKTKRDGFNQESNSNMLKE